MASTINASTTSTTGLVYSADGTGILQLQSDGTTGLTVSTGGNVTVNTNLFVSGSEVKPLVLGNVQTTTSGNSVVFTSIPTWVKRISFIINGVSTNGTNSPIVQVGSGSLTTTGYLGATTNQGAIASYSSLSTGFTIGTGGSATNTITGTLVLSLITGNTWVASGSFAYENTTYLSYTAGKIVLSGILDRIGIVTADIFDAGSVNIMYE